MRGDFAPKSHQAQTQVLGLECLCPVPPLPLAACETLDKSLPLSKTQFPILYDKG